MTETTKVIPNLKGTLEDILKNGVKIESDDQAYRESIPNLELKKVLPGLFKYLRTNYSFHNLKPRVVNTNLEFSIDFYDVFGSKKRGGIQEHVGYLTFIYTRDKQGKVDLQSAIYGEDPKNNAPSITLAWYSKQGRIDSYRHIDFP